jgi:chromosome partitioning protein
MSFMRETKKAALVMQKGGCGKTTTATNVAAELALRGNKVLVIDLDPQAHATISLGIDEASPQVTVYDVMLGKKDLKDVIIHTETSGLDVVPSNYDLVGAETELSQRIGREFIIKKALEKLDGYDYVILDTPPNLGVLTVNAIVASPLLLIPLQVEYLPMAGYAHLIKTLDNIDKYLDHRPKQRVLLTMYDARTKDSEKVASDIRGYFKDIVLKTVIPRNVSLSRAPSHGKPISVFSPSSSGAIAYKELVDELLAEEFSEVV